MDAVREGSKNSKNFKSEGYYQPPPQKKNLIVEKRKKNFKYQQEVKKKLFKDTYGDLNI